MRGNLVKWNISVARGKETNQLRIAYRVSSFWGLAISGLLDSQSSGERNGTSLNPIYLELDESAASQDARARFLFDGCRTHER